MAFITPIGTGNTGTPSGKQVITLPILSSNNQANKGLDMKKAFGLTVAGGLVGGASSFIQALGAKNTYKNQALNYDAQADTARANQGIAQINIESAFRTGEYQALLQGLQDAQEISSTRASTASSGVRLNSGSTADVEATQRMNAKLNQIQIQKQTTANVSNARMQLANAKAQEIIAEGNTTASRIMAKGSNPFIQGALGFISSMALTDLSFQAQGFNSPTAWGFKTWL